MNKVAIVHDWFDTYAGSERVVEQFLELFPQADVFALVDFLPADQRAFLQGRSITTSFIQHLPGARRSFRRYLPLFPLAVEQFDLSGYDLVLSSSHAVAKGVLTGPDQLHISYVHSPIRYAWDLQHQYLSETGLDRGIQSWLVRYSLHRLRLWDVRSATGVDHLVANSRYIARRIRKAYRRTADVIPPPVDVGKFTTGRDREDFYLTASRLVPYKRVDLIVDAFRHLPDRELVVIGDGPERDKVRGLSGPNVTLLGYQPDEVLVNHMQRARGFIFAAEEDFGILPVEAMACGTPVIAYGRGGALDSVRGLDHANPTGVFFPEQTAEAIAATVRQFESVAERFSPSDVRRHAESFGHARFRERMSSYIDEKWRRFLEDRGG